MNLLEQQLNFNLNFLFDNPGVEKKPIDQLIERLVLIDQCIDHTMFLILLEKLDGLLPSANLEKYLISKRLTG